MEDEKVKISREQTVKKRIPKFVGVGATLTLINFSLYTILARIIFKSNDVLWLAVLISSIVATMIAYFLHARITWKERDPVKLGWLKFFIWNGVEAIIINPILAGYFGLFKVIYYIAFDVCQMMRLPLDFEFVESTGVFVLMSTVTMTINFLFYNKFVFEKGRLKITEKL